MFKTMVLAVCEASGSDNIEVRLKGLILLVKTAKFGYEYLKDDIDDIVTVRIKIDFPHFFQILI